MCRCRGPRLTFRRPWNCQRHRAGQTTRDKKVGVVDVKLAIMQPYPFPYLGYFHLMAQVDRWIVLDGVQYARRTSRCWMNRNRILHPRDGWQYFVFPVKKRPLGTPMNQMLLADKEAALRRLCAQLEHYRKHAPYFAMVVEMVREVFRRTETDFLVELNVRSLEVVLEVLGMNARLEPCPLIYDTQTVTEEIQLALRLAKQLRADTYINLPGGREIYDRSEWKSAGIDLIFTEMIDFRYDCKPYAFEPNLSIIDILMWNRAADISQWLKSRQCESLT